MRFGLTAWGLALAAAAALPAPAAEAGDATRTASKKFSFTQARAYTVKEGRSVARASGRLDYAPGYGPRRRGSGGLGFAPLVGDPGTGLGFHALPGEVRFRAARYAARAARPPWQNPVRFAIMADAARYDTWLPVANTGYRYGVFNPNDGVGTPFFAGWYGPAGGYDDAPTLLGRPYPR